MYIHLFWFSAIVKGLIGTSDSVTNSVNVHRIPVLFKSLMASIQKLDFLEFNFISKVRACIFCLHDQ